MVNRNWRLPAGVDELLPPAAWSLELVRRQVLDVFHTWGFEYVDPPIIEYLDALLVDSGADMDLQTLKVVDRRSPPATRPMRATAEDTGTAQSLR